MTSDKNQRPKPKPRGDLVKCHQMKLCFGKPRFGWIRYDREEEPLGEQEVPAASRVDSSRKKRGFLAGRNVVLVAKTEMIIPIYL